MTSRVLSSTIAAAGFALLTAGSAGAQQPVEPPAVESKEPAHPPGWTITPSVGASESWDDNPTLAAFGDQRMEDFVTTVRPRLKLGFRGPQTNLALDYGGNFDFYRDLSSLDTSEHRASLDFTRRVNRRVRVFARDIAMLSPTTGLVDLVATPLVRQTSKLNSFRGGIETTLARHTTLTTGYSSQWVDFSTDEDTEALLQGGFSNGAEASLRHHTSERLALGVDYDFERAIVAHGGDTFSVQSALGVVEYSITPAFAVLLAGGHAWLDAGQDAEQTSRGGPTFRVGLGWSNRRLSGDIAYGRAFLPSFGFGGTFQNEELRANLRWPVSRWLEWSNGVVWSNNDPLTIGDPKLSSVAAQSTMAFLVMQRLRLEAFGIHSFQDSGQAGGRVSRTRAGVQASIFHQARLR